MAHKIPASVHSDLDVMFRLGSAVDLSDGQLLDRVDASGGEPAEAAFAVLVERHGPMVLRACRDAIGNPHDAEDACQAVFLVLARKAGSVRRRESAAGWLFGVARKVSSRARRDEARRRRHELRKVEQAPRRPPDEARPESWDELYEEVGRLPEVYRSAVVLCHLEGLTHEEAANRLRCPLRTLQSRLLRARARLKDRLARRGMAPGAGAVPVLVPCALPAKFAASIARVALSKSAGAIPAAVSALADGVLAMSTSTKIIPAIVALLAIGAAAGVAWAVGSGRGGQPDAAPPPPEVAKPAPAAVPEPKPAVAAEEKDEGRGPVAARGTVVDEAGRPVAGAEVVANAFTTREARGVTGADGSFAVPIPNRLGRWTSLLARSADGKSLGLLQQGRSLSKEMAKDPVRVVLKPGRPITVRVADPNNAPIPGATVDVIGGFVMLAEATTGPDGSASVVIPADGRVEWIVALKSGRGMDYAEYGQIDEAGRTRDGVAVPEVPASVPLVLDGARTAKIRAVDAQGKPLAGVAFGPWLIQKVGRGSNLNLGDYRAMTAKTDADGVATFDYLPATSKGQLAFWPRDEAYTRRRVVVEEDTTGPVSTTLTRNETIRGRVVHGDGSPAPGIRVRALGTGQGMDHGQATARTAADGSYEMTLPPGEAYAVFVEDPEWAASSRLDVVLLSGRPATGVDFALSRGTLLRGRVTVGSEGRPVAGQHVTIQEGTGKQAPAEVLEEGNRLWREVMRHFGATTDAEGRYSIRVGPGRFKVWGPARTETWEVAVADESEIVRDFKMPRAEKGPISGRVVDAATGRGVAGARFEIMASNQRAFPFVVTADAEGRFRAERDLDPLTIHAWNGDRSLGAIVEVGAEDPEVVIALSPTATATGLLLDDKGRPAANQKLDWGRRVYLDPKKQLSMTLFAPKVVTDAAGKFTLPHLVVGQPYDISVERNGTYLPTGLVRPESPSAIDLGTLKVGGYQRPLTAAEMSSFEGGPGPGDPAPAIEGTTLDGRPLKLADFRGKFVLLDFWATWCGPCIGEIPRLQAIHEAFGNDGRFAILSLSVDEKIEEPRRFQETRKLPWSQGFLGEGIHSPIPGSYGVRAIPAFVLIGPDGRIVAKGMRGDDIKAEVARALGGKP